MNSYTTGLLLSLYSVFIGTPSPNQNYTIILEEPLPNKIEVDFSNIKNSGLTKLKTNYFGISGNIPESKHIDYTKTLSKLWERKLSIKKLKPSVKKSASFIVDRYTNSNKEYKTLSNLLDEVNKDITIVKNTIDVEGICHKYKIDDYGCDNLKESVEDIDSRVLISYGMTELFPYRNGKYSAVSLDTLLQTAGENYIHSIPALGDGYLSTSLYQWTSFAIYDMGKKKEGANIIAQYSNYSIPGSVIYLDSKDQHRAALYFATYNLTRLFKSMSKKQNKVFYSNCNKTISNTQFIATAHHLPSYAIDNMKKWVDSKCKSDYIDFNGPNLKVYAEKTSANYNALGDY